VNSCVWRVVQSSAAHVNVIALRGSSLSTSDGAGVDPEGAGRACVVCSSEEAGDEDAEEEEGEEELRAADDEAKARRASGVDAARRGREKAGQGRACRARPFAETRLKARAELASVRCIVSWE
jgi:hypothetical protein